MRAGRVIALVGREFRFSPYPEQQAEPPVTLSSYVFRREFRTNGVGMTNISKSRSKYTGLTRALAVAGVAALAMVLGNGTASAGVDNSSSVVDARGNRIEVLQGDTQFQVVPPLDGVPTSVEFFHNGYAGVNITGPNAAEFTGTKLTIGYQIGYPITLSGATVVLNSPGLGFVIGASNGIDLGLVPTPSLSLNASNHADLAGDIIPSQELDIDLAPGGITTVPLLENQSFDGPAASVRFAGHTRFHLGCARGSHHPAVRDSCDGQGRYRHDLRCAAEAQLAHASLHTFRPAARHRSRIGVGQRCPW